MSFRIDPATLAFALPDDRIAQVPSAERDQARLLVLNRADGAIAHRRFADIGDYLRAGDVLVLNKARVSKAKLVGKKSTGGKIEVIFLERNNGNGEWKALLRPPVKDGAAFEAGPGLKLSVKTRLADGEYILSVVSGDIEWALTNEGRLPLPPYIKRRPNDPLNALDEREYQTVYATHEGSVAAPTAGLHFSERLLSQLKAKGVKIVEVLLHVGWGTFKPIMDTIESHRMLSERYEVSDEAYAEVVLAKKENRRVIAVGTTSTRTLESIEADRLTGGTALFIKPGYQFRRVDALITNLHVPRSTPVSLTAAFAGLKNLENAYAAAIQENYRFYSYGDAMLVI